MKNESNPVNERKSGFYYILLEKGITIAAWKQKEQQWYLCGDTEGFTDEDIETVLSHAPDIMQVQEIMKYAPQSVSKLQPPAISAEAPSPTKFLETDGRFDLSDPMNHIKLRNIDIFTLMRNYAEYLQRQGQKTTN